jgi:hypothetical protein
MNNKGSQAGMITDEMIMNRIYVLRGRKVMIDEDLALLYKAGILRIRTLIVKHADRFPEDFMFKLNQEDFTSLKLQDTSVKRKAPDKGFPLALTEQGLAMLSGLVKGSRPIAVNIRIIRIFTLIRQVLPDYPELSRELARFNSNIICHK